MHNRPSVDMSSPNKIIDDANDSDTTEHLQYRLAPISGSKRQLELTATPQFMVGAVTSANVGNIEMITVYAVYSTL